MNLIPGSEGALIWLSFQCKTKQIYFNEHIMDQNRLKSRLYRHLWDDIYYLMPEKPEKIK